MCDVLRVLFAWFDSDLFAGGARWSLGGLHVSVKTPVWDYARDCSVDV